MHCKQHLVNHLGLTHRTERGMDGDGDGDQCIVSTVAARTTSEIVDQRPAAHAFRSRAKIYMASTRRGGGERESVACRPCLTSNDTSATVPRARTPQIIKFLLS